MVPHNSPVVKFLFGVKISLPTMAQMKWESNIFKPLDMSAISGYRNIPLKHETWFPKFPGNDVTTAKEHISNFWAFFQCNHVSDDIEDLVMKIFSATLTDVSRRWYDSLPDKRTNTMDQLKEKFLNRWNNKEDPSILLT
jgi:hypothetical protein